MNFLPSRPTAPGRPKDPEKRAAILEAAKHLFTERGYDGVSMDAIAQAASVSKLTVYSHFRDKETLFTAAVKARCEEQMPHEIFEARPSGPIREQLLAIGEAFVTLFTSDEAVSLMRTMMAESRLPTPLARLFYEAGPQRTHDEFVAFLLAQCQAGRLRVPDCQLASGHFFSMLKGDIHMRLMIGCGEAPSRDERRAHIESVVDLFLRAHAPAPERPA